MVSMDVFNASAFDMTSLTGMVEEIDYKPQLLGELGIFTPKPVSTRSVFVDRQADKLELIGTTPTGAPPQRLKTSLRNAVSLRTTRLAEGFRLMAEEVQGLRPFGQENGLETVQAEYARRTQRLIDDLELTFELHRLGALQGKLLDADDSVIYDYFDEFGITEPAAINFALGTATTDVRGKCKEIVRGMAKSAKGAMAGATIHALCGDDFYDQLTGHANVEKFYMNWAGSEDLRQNSGAFGAFPFEGIVFHNYRGTDEESPVSIASNEAHFFPVGARETFSVAYSPAEFGPYVNTQGRDRYMINVPDRDRQAYTDGELYSYPLFLCQRPGLLRKAVAS